MPSRTTFGSPLDLPRWDGGAHADRLGLSDELVAWCTSPPMRELIETSGWQWPEQRQDRQVVRHLAQLSRGWDLRQGGERSTTSSPAPTVAGRALDLAMVTRSAHQLGLVAASPPRRAPTQVVALGGLVQGCVNRIHLASVVAQQTGCPLSVLSGDRPLDGAELETASAAGLGAVANEADAVIRVLQKQLGLGEPSRCWGDLPVGTRGWSRTTSGGCTWEPAGEPKVDVVVAPSMQPALRRTTTRDQLRFWAEHAALDSHDHVMIVTTQTYVPFQHFSAIRILGLDARCGIETTGVDAASALMPLRSGPHQWLQELHAALHSASDLVDVL